MPTVWQHVGRPDNRDGAQAHRAAEAQFLQQVLLAARLHHWAAYHTHDSRRSPAGFPDLVLCRPPRCLFRELKTDTGRLTPAQGAWLAALRACGLDAAVWRPRDWAEIERSLQGAPHE